MGSNQRSLVFATDSGFDRGYISGVERGVRKPSALVLARLANFLDVDIVELLDLAKAQTFARTFVRTFVRTFALAANSKRTAGQ